jgi:hypothetical protein
MCPHAHELIHPHAYTLKQASLDAEKKRNEKGKLSFSAKEKRKRDLGQASRAKNYVEEEKRILREAGGN